MTINYTSGNDIIIPTNNTTYRGLDGDDIYIISQATPANSSLSIIDTTGKNIIQLVDGLSISSTNFTTDALRLILSNGSVITINGANEYLYEVGGNITSGVTEEKKSYSDFSKLFGVEQIPLNRVVDGVSNLTIKNDSLILNNLFSWIEKTPESIGLDAIEVNELMDFVKVPGFNTQAAILIQGNNIIAE